MANDNEPRVTVGTPSSSEQQLAHAVNLLLAGHQISEVMTVIMSLLCDGANQMFGDDDDMFDKFCNTIVTALRTARDLRKAEGSTKH